MKSSIILAESNRLRTSGARLLLALALVMVLILLSVNVVVSAANTRRIAENNRRVLQTTNVLRQLEVVVSTLMDAETGQRGYVVTGKEEYLEPYRSALLVIQEEVDGLGPFADPVQLGRLGTLRSKIGEQLEVMRKTVAIRRDRGLEPAVQLMQAGHGKRVMDEIRGIVDGMLDSERTLLSLHILASEKSLGRAFVAFAASTVVAFAVLVALAIVVLRGLASRERAEEVLLGQLQRWEVTLASIGDAVIVTDAGGLVSFLNPVAESLCGLDWRSAGGRPLDEVYQTVGEGTRLPLESPVARLLREEVEAIPADHAVLISADGTERPILENAAPVRDRRGQLDGIVLIFRDDTRNREHARRLETVIRQKDEFLAMLAHELRNPLAAIRMAIEGFEASTEETHLRWTRDVIERQSDHLTHLVDGIQDVARMTRGKVRLLKQVIDAGMVIDQAVASVRPVLDERGHCFELSIAGREMLLNADPARLEQILVNLLTNAAKFTPRGGRIRLAAVEESGQLVLRVADDGIGIDPEELASMFELFVQGDRSAGRTGGGLGIGLTIVKEMVELHGGSVSARSDGSGTGCEFTVRLPTLEGRPVALPPALVDETRPILGNRILIIDDNKDLALGLGLLLESLGHVVHAAHDGQEGIEEARDFQPDVILLDIGLPTKDGYEVARELRGDPLLKGVLIIGISGYGREEDRRLSLLAGMDHHLAKPVRIREITNLIALPV